MTLIFKKAIFPQNSWRDTTILPRNDIKGLCLILDQDLLSMEPVQAMSAGMRAGIRFFQYRCKTGSRRHIYDVSLRLSQLARKCGSLFIVNDHADIAVAVDAHGVHLGQDDLPIEEARKVVGGEKLIGISTHSKEQAVAAEANRADYIGFGPIFRTATKDAGGIQGVPALRAIKQATSIPVIAIGGINQGNVREVMTAGADGAAVISAILCAPDFGKAAAEMVGLTE
jgi:thiamine-phosphate pyrophosphorylase